MKIRSWLFKALLVTVLLLPAQTQAHYLWIDTVGDQTAELSDTIDVSIYFHAESDVGTNMWGLTMGFDDTAIDGGELTFESVTYGETNLGVYLMATEAVVNEGGSLTYDGESTVKYIARDCGFGSAFDWISADSDKLLATVSFTFNGGSWDGEDIWLEWDYDTAFAWTDESGNSIGIDTILDVYTDSTGTVLLAGNGPDYAAAPVPAAVWLLGSGIVGLVGIRRRRA